MSNVAVFTVFMTNNNLKLITNTRTTILQPTELIQREILSGAITDILWKVVQFAVLSFVGYQALYLSVFWDNRGSCSNSRN